MAPEPYGFREPAVWLFQRQPTACALAPTALSASWRIETKPIGAPRASLKPQGSGILPSQRSVRQLSAFTVPKSATADEGRRHQKPGLLRSRV